MLRSKGGSAKPEGMGVYSWEPWLGRRAASSKRRISRKNPQGALNSGVGDAMKPPKTQYARSGDFSIAYQVVGDGPLDLVHIPGLVSHLDHAWTHPKYERFMRLLSSFARVIVYDKRGTGPIRPVHRTSLGRGTDRRHAGGHGRGRERPSGRLRML